jgi:uncharacterized protein YdeI (YjbR/CyaY-like superfamily)
MKPPPSRSSGKPRFFRSASDFRLWLQKNSARAEALLVGYYKVGTNRRKAATGEAGQPSRPSLTWPESVEQALCFGWIDGRRKSLDATRYIIRFSPRKRGSIWSAVNIRRVAELRRLGLMQPAGLAAFAARRENRSGVYSYEQRPEQLPRAYASQLDQAPRAQAFFAAQPPSYQRAAIWWVISAKQEATRMRRLARLISDSRRGQRLKQFTVSKSAANKVSVGARAAKQD